MGMESDRLNIDNEVTRRIVESAELGIITIDSDSLIDFVNPKMADMLGSEVEDIIGKPLTIYMDDEGRAMLAYYLERRRQGVSEQFEFKFLRLDGTELWVHVSTNPLLNERGEYLGALAMFTDITERREARRLLEWEASVFTAISVQAPMDQVLEDLILGFEQLLPGSRCSVRLMQGESLSLGSSPSLPAEVEQLFSIEGSPCWEAIRQRTQLVCDDVTTDPLWKSLSKSALKHGLKGCCISPFFTDSEKIDGIFAVFFESRAAIGARELNAIERATEIIEIGIGRRRTEEKLKASQQSLQDANESLRKLNEKLERRAASRTRKLAALATEITYVEERERLRAADAIHGDLLQLLASAKLRLGVVKGQLRPEVPPSEVEQIQGILQQALEIGQSLIRGLYPPVLQSGDLHLALEWLAEQNRNSGLEVVTELPADLEIDDAERRVTLFRSAAELMANVRRHAQASTASVRVDLSPDGAVELTVGDNGVGFVPSQTNERRDGGFGLFCLRERIEAFGGKVGIDSAPGRGCRVTLNIPPATNLG